jgi:hypothetical protein
MHVRKSARLSGTVLAALAAGSLIWSASARADVGTAAVSWTPAVTSPDATVRQLAQCGSTMYAVGSFSQVTQGGQTYARHNAFSFSALTGAVTTWNPNVNGEVNSIALTGDCRRAFLGGEFTYVRGQTVGNLAALDAQTATVDTSFQDDANDEVDTVALVDDDRDLMVGGAFTAINGADRAYYVSLGSRFGVVSGYFHKVVAGRLAGFAGQTKVYNQQVSPSGDRLLVEGDFTKIGRHHRQQVAELDLSATRATIDGWGNAVLASKRCNRDTEFYVRAAAFSPDEQTIYLAATGHTGSSPYCDAVTALANVPGAPVLWINKTGGDSLYAVAASPTGVFIGGHERWADNPLGRDTCRRGCVPRPGIGEISATTGLATDWNPTRGRGHGADDLLLTSAGLWVASDTFFGAVDCAGAYHPGICFLPDAG